MPVRSKTPYLVFINHSATDLWVAQQIAIHVKGCGAEVFLDEEQIAVGADFDEEIRDALERASELLILLTPWSLGRPYVWAEAGLAWGRRLPIIGLLNGLTSTDLRARPEVPIFLKKRDLLDLNGIAVYLGQLRKRVRAIQAASKRGPR
jgi:hypothetical protein